METQNILFAFLIHNNVITLRKFNCKFGYYDNELSIMDSGICCFTHLSFDGASDRRRYVEVFRPSFFAYQPTDTSHDFHTDIPNVLVLCVNIALFRESRRTQFWFITIRLSPFIFGLLLPLNVITFPGVSKVCICRFA